MKDQYAATKSPAIIEVPRGTYLTVDGTGAPGGPAYQAAFPPLYGLAYTVKMTRKFKKTGPDFAVGRIESLWWVDSGEADFSAVPPEKWRWKVLIKVHDDVKAPEVDRARATLRERGKGEGVETVKLERMHQGTCVQVLHVGPYAEEPASMKKMREFAESQGYGMQGRHHEIYISDPRRVAPEKLKTILRVPVMKAR